jgi:hypothetical protein
VCAHSSPTPHTREKDVDLNSFLVTSYIVKTIPVYLEPEEALPILSELYREFWKKWKWRIKAFKFSILS